MSVREPVMRCCGCKKLLSVMEAQSAGKCECGNRRIEEIKTLTEDEMKMVQERWPLFATKFIGENAGTGGN